MSHTALILLLTAVALWPGAARAAASVSIEGLRVVSSTTGSSGGLSWAVDGPLALNGTVVVAGLHKEAKTELLLVVYDEQGEVFVKQKRRQQLGNGRHQLSILGLLPAAGVFGLRSFRAELEVVVKGAEAVRGEVLFTVSGPPPPVVVFHELQVFDPLQGRGSGARSFAPGETFAIDAVVEISGNLSAVDPELRILAAMLEDIRDVDPDSEHQPWIEHWDVRRLGADGGVLRIYATGRLPLYFADPYEQEHRFTVEVRLDFGGGTMSSGSAEGRIIDFQNGDNRRNDDLQMRTIELARAYTWDIRPLAQALADDVSDAEDVAAEER